MNNLDKKIFEHICCEYKWGFSPFPGNDDITDYMNRQRIALFEEQGQIPKIDQYVEGFKNFIITKILPYIKDGGTYAEQIKNPSELGVEYPFFNMCNIDVIASIREGTISWKGGYDPDKSYFNEYGGYVTIRISVGAPKEQYLLSTLLTTFAHELTHAYDDYMAFKLGNPQMSQIIKDSGYTDKVMVWNVYRNFGRDLGKLLYLLSPIERNAIIGQISGDIESQPVDTPQEALTAVKNSKAYRSYLEIRNLVAEFNCVEDDSTKIIILSAYKMVNKKAGKNITYEGFLTDINAQFKKWERKFLNTAGKIAYTKYWKKEMTKWDYHNDEKEPLLKNNINEGFERERTCMYDIPSMNIIDNDIT